MTLDGQAVAAGSAIGSSGFVAVRMPLAPGSHALRCPGRCAAMVHGYGAANGFATAVGFDP